ncbi:multiple inositol polyphosphate phosphatase 1 [Lingula anatina]|uniref:Multiple inositol polyphosphate phosphatase 1 n=1 Tax=Lingula anatina TaxID=7574 RepID=A0A1S3IN70_LINAN|nr:multiple inositol polyphosphate phosphatase 1 [Lingula anatina]|eukprot:XP_013399528.1 multiple inositol polyphosphate phosphatase 1 [Lingula anatina]
MESWGILCAVALLCILPTVHPEKKLLCYMTEGDECGPHNGKCYVSFNGTHVFIYHKNKESLEFSMELSRNDSNSKISACPFDETTETCFIRTTTVQEGATDPDFYIYNGTWVEKYEGAFDYKDCPCDGYHNYEKSYRFYGLKTSYNQVYWAHYDVADAPPDAGTRANETIPGCEPAFVWYLGREAVEYPPSDLISKMIRKLPTIRDTILKAEPATRSFEQEANPDNNTMCWVDLERLRAWTTLQKPRFVDKPGNKAVDVQYGGKITYDQIWHLFQIGLRLRNRFPKLLASFNRTLFNFKTADVENIRDSGLEVGAGVFNVTGLWFVEKDRNRRKFLSKVPFEAVGQSADHLLSYHTSCYKYFKQSSYVQQEEKFMNSVPVQRMIQGLKKRLGLKHLSFGDARLAYEACRSEDVLYEKGGDYGPSPWCAIFTEEDLKVMEYMEDLVTYAKVGYGRAINQLMTCELVDDLVTYVEQVKEGKINMSGVFRFASKDVLLSFFTVMGLFKDKLAPVAGNYETQRDRKWRTSLIAGFASNLQAALYTCPMDPQTNKTKAYVQIMVNEKERLFPGCDSAFCDYDIFYKKLKPFAQACDFQRICGDIEVSWRRSAGFSLHASAQNAMYLLMAVLTYICIFKSHQV